MDMRAIEDIGAGEDLTPPLPPLAAVLQDSALASYCSACFSTLPPPPLNYTPTLLYCSPHCSSNDSSSADHHLLSLFTQSPPYNYADSSDLRLSLRLLNIFQTKHSILQRFPCSISSGRSPLFEGETEYPFQEIEHMERIAGLMTNREMLMFGENGGNQFQENRRYWDESCENAERVLEIIKEGVKIMAMVRRMCLNEDEKAEKQEDLVLMEMVLCLVMTNAVEVQDKSGSSIGVAVYDTSFSWINHSCSPNACFRFSLQMDGNEQTPLRITPAATNGVLNLADLKHQLSERNGFGPRIIVRSIKAVNKGEEVTIAYTDLLQPRETRQQELWSKYGFNCSCMRCAAIPTTYVDYALQAFSADNPDLDNKKEELMQNFDDAITDYLSSGNPKLCCKKLEDLLCHGDTKDKFLEPKEAQSPQKLKLHPFHQLSLNSYTTLGSAYKVQASDLLALDYGVEEHKLEAYNMCKISSAYSLLLAVVVNHLFNYEPSVVASVANFWINAGESLMDLARNPRWDSFLKGGFNHFELSPFLHLKCNDCHLVDTSESSSHSPGRKLQLEKIKTGLYNCIANITPKVWRILASESHFLKLIQNPVDVRWLASPVIPDVVQFESEELGYESRASLIVLSIHCLRYGSLLSNICYGLSAENLQLQNLKD